MRREGYIIEEIIEYSNMSEAFDAVLRGTDRKESIQGKKLLAHREEVISKLTAAIETVRFNLVDTMRRKSKSMAKVASCRFYPCMTASQYMP